MGQGLVTPEERELKKKRAVLTTLEGELAERELAFATLRNELGAFEARYLRTVGTLYAELDELEAQIAEAQARERPEESTFRERATHARVKATESAEAVGAVAEIAAADRFKPSDELRTLYREVARCIHPDLATDDKSRSRRTRLMAEANAAYTAGDETKLKAILDDWQSDPETVEGEGIAAELVRTIRKIHQVEQRLAAISSQIADLTRSSDMVRLKEQVEAAEANGQGDLLAQMADEIRRQIGRARTRVDELKVGARP